MDFLQDIQAYQKWKEVLIWGGGGGGGGLG